MRSRLVVARAVVTAVALAIGIAACSDSTTQSSNDTPNPAAGANETIAQLTVGATTLGAGSLDPTKGLAPWTELIYERLMTFSDDGQVEPQLAESVEQPDPTTYIYHLRKGVSFWNGNEMTAADVVNSLDYQRALDAQSAQNFLSVDSITAIDDSTVEVKLKFPDASWQYVLAYAGVIFEKKFHDEKGDTMGQPGVLVMATGPWQVDSFDPNGGAEYSANPNWWGGDVAVEHITGKIFSDENSMALAFRAGDIDVAFPRDGRAFAATSGQELTGTVPVNGVGYFTINAKIAPWDDVHVRRAVAHAINRQDYVDARGGHAEPTETIILRDQLETLASAAEVDTLLASLPQYPYDLEKAKAELAQSAYPNGFTATTDVPNYSIYPMMNEIVAAQLAKIGITLELNQVDIGQWVSDYYGPKTYGTNFVTYFSTSPDPSSQPIAILGSQNTGNAADWGPPEVDALLEAGRTTSDPAERLRLYGEVLEHAATDLPYVPLFREYGHLALSSRYSWPTEFTRFQTINQWPLLLSPKS